ncbi:Oxidoreductase [Labilithrix luteola]|uniref:Oxidoreductase n=1 Tax=Labilithrix luteola TaxID=1391654 RepID=A0A0K1PX89_9BACT|nr:epimerase [Labilithrix luteola]AKU98138.1 Oxidoreductase [Labilithrix luteola]
MKVIVFGATGMVGQGVLRECLLDPGITQVLVVGRSSTGRTDAKLREIVVPNVGDLSGIEGELTGLDACFFCVGVSSAGMSEEAYRRVTYDLAVSVATTLVKTSPQMTFVFVSGGSTDSTEKGPTMWARVKGATENAILALPFAASYAVRPGFIQPLHGITSKTKLYRILYAVLAPFTPLLAAIVPDMVTNTERVGRAMIRLAREGADKRVLENKDLDALGRLERVPSIPKV